MEKYPAQNVVEFYVLANRLKQLIRTGWKQWNVERERLESVAEHVYSVNMLAISMWSEYDYISVNLSKVCIMIAIHELEEIYIGDITPFQGVSPEEKERIGHEAVQRILAPLVMKNTYYGFIQEFDERKTKDAIFAYMCDKLDADLMSIIYDFDRQCSLQKARKNLRDYEKLKKIKLQGAVSMSDYFYEADKEKYDEHFREVLECMYSRRFGDVDMQGELENSCHIERMIYTEEGKYRFSTHGEGTTKAN